MHKIKKSYKLVFAEKAVYNLVQNVCMMLNNKNNVIKNEKFKHEQF